MDRSCIDGLEIRRTFGLRSINKNQIDYPTNFLNEEKIQKIILILRNQLTLLLGIYGWNKIPYFKWFYCIILIFLIAPLLYVLRA